MFQLLRNQKLSHLALTNMYVRAQKDLITTKSLSRLNSAFFTDNAHDDSKVRIYKGQKKKHFHQQVGCTEMPIDVTGGASERIPFSERKDETRPNHTNGNHKDPVDPRKVRIFKSTLSDVEELERDVLGKKKQKLKKLVIRQANEAYENLKANHKFDRDSDNESEDYRVYRKKEE